MITITFNPETPDQAALVGALLPDYLRAGRPVTSTTVEMHTAAPAPDAVQKMDATALEAVQKMDTLAPKRTRAAKKEEPAATPPAAEPDQPAAAEPAPAAASPSEPITLEVVRAKLAALSQAGKAQSVKALIADYGVAKLTEIAADKYAEVLAKAEALA